MTRNRTIPSICISGTALKITRATSIFSWTDKGTWITASPVENVARHKNRDSAAGAPATERTTPGENLEVLARRLSQYSINLGCQVGGVAFCFRRLTNRTLHDVNVCTNGSDIHRRIGKEGLPAFCEAERQGTIRTMGQIEIEKRETIHRHIALRGEGGVQDRRAD
ncbi:hypothetical protein C8R44DRAFT_736111 [Mycena epipterygia]|nr:hypothetical protein C8R44DRAFT_736111 [Mycena epipterygia]